MKRATITIPDDLESEMGSYMKAQDAPPSLNGIVEAALRRFLEESGWNRGSTVLLAAPSRLRLPRRGAAGVTSAPSTTDIWPRTSDNRPGRRRYP
jgi:hypothetical protein